MIHDSWLMRWVLISPFRPWYGGEVGFASSQFSGHQLPVIGLDMDAGSTDNLALDDCGLKPTVEGTTGQWTTETLAHPAEQTLGRVHHASDGAGGSVSVEVAIVENGIAGEFVPLQENTLLPEGEAYRLKFIVTDTCMSSAWVDVNDPSLQLSGRVFGTNDGIDDEYSALPSSTTKLCQTNPCRLEPSRTTGPLEPTCNPEVPRSRSRFVHGSRGTQTAPQVIPLSNSPTLMCRVVTKLRGMRTPFVTPSATKR